ncbi:Rieske 2Fe-2S domain-containing protein [Thalassotalea sp. PLHSN55]|uniref:Rieske 2Fe-2S domain-containing protein n=1 Tax=Thalassotalea sp. PLHSN55 TaxID=3435888 RepID=UPI003F8463A5
MKKQSELNCFYPAGAKSATEIAISNVEQTSREDVFIGYAVLPSSTTTEKVVIYQLLLDDNSEDLRLISARCPHKGADISQDPLKADGNVYCSIHRRPICIYSEYNQAYSVSKRGQSFFIDKTNSS